MVCLHVEVEKRSWIDLMWKERILTMFIHHFQWKICQKMVTRAKSQFGRHCCLAPTALSEEDTQQTSIIRKRELAGVFVHYPLNCAKSIYLTLIRWFPRDVFRTGYCRSFKETFYIKMSVEVAQVSNKVKMAGYI